MKPKSKNLTASSPKSAKKPTKTSKPACAKSAKVTYRCSDSEKPSDAPSAAEALANIISIRRALSVCFLLSKLSRQEGILMTEELFNGVEKIIEALVEHLLTAAQVEDEK